MRPAVIQALAPLRRPRWICMAQWMSSFWNTPSSMRLKVFSQCGSQSAPDFARGISMRCIQRKRSGATGYTVIRLR
ncbi:MAG: hypothetical protein EBU07_14070 [Betaproteobacteria bacterium]|nr:hypothetical protein [Betaproteobacteria bacterium]NBS46805.1 hypothetical protein [Betaproteobacteria bacterium]